jgi:prepilin-type N-terminal cleavage/methylation domain-containing protein
MRKQKGFSLIELLIVVAIILIIAAIAIPNLLRSRMAANEASAVGSIRTINTAEVTYASTYPNVGFADTLTALGPDAAGVGGTSAHSGLIDIVLGCAAMPCVKSGYQFALLGVAGPPVATYTINGDPQTVGQTGQRHFCSDQSGVIRYDVTAAIGANAGANCDPAIAPLQ